MRKVFEEMNEVMNEATGLFASQMNAEALSMMDDNQLKLMKLYGKLVLLTKEYMKETSDMMDKIDMINEKLDIVLLTKK